MPVATISGTAIDELIDEFGCGRICLLNELDKLAFDMIHGSKFPELDVGAYLETFSAGLVAEKYRKYFSKLQTLAVNYNRFVGLLILTIPLSGLGLNVNGKFFSVQLIPLFLVALLGVRFPLSGKASKITIASLIFLAVCLYSNHLEIQ